MSVQTACEMLSIEVMEKYAEKYDLTGDEVAELFHKNHIIVAILEKNFIQPFCCPNRKNGHIDFL